MGDLSVDRLLDAVAARTTAPGGGAVSALAAALAAALTAMAARFSGGAGEPGSVAAADALRARAAVLAEADVAAYTRYVDARRHHPADVPAALAEAVDVPLRIAEVAAEIAVLAQDLAARGNPRLRGDAATACWLASAAAQAARALVAENLPDSPDDARLAWAQECARRAAEAAALNR